MLTALYDEATVKKSAVFEWYKGFKEGWECGRFLLVWCDKWLSTRVAAEELNLVLGSIIFIERGFEERNKTEVVVIELTAAYDAVWREGLK